MRHGTFRAGFLWTGHLTGDASLYWIDFDMTALNCNWCLIQTTAAGCCLQSEGSLSLNRPVESMTAAVAVSLFVSVCAFAARSPKTL